MKSWHILDGWRENDSWRVEFKINHDSKAKYDCILKTFLKNKLNVTKQQEEARMSGYHYQQLWWNWDAFWQCHTYHSHSSSEGVEKSRLGCNITFVLTQYNKCMTTTSPHLIWNQFHLHESGKQWQCYQKDTRKEKNIILVWPTMAQRCGRRSDLGSWGMHQRSRKESSKCVTIPPAHWQEASWK